MAAELTAALLRAEGAPAAGPYLDNTAAYLHVLPAAAVHTAAPAAAGTVPARTVPARTVPARTVRVQVLTPPGALDRAGQRALVADVTAIVAKISGDPGQRKRTWVLLQEAAEPTDHPGLAPRSTGQLIFAAGRMECQAGWTLRSLSHTVLDWRLLTTAEAAGAQSPSECFRCRRSGESVPAATTEFSLTRS